MTPMSTEAKPRHSVGVAMKRKEDPRFIQGKGHYVDDLSFPGMLYLALVRSPYPHAEIKSIDIAEAMKVPGVKAVITGKDLEAAGLGWLPTFHGFDKQMVLAIGKVLFQYQEVAAVFAESRAAAADGAEAVQVDYAPLPVVADPFTAKTDKVLLRPDREAEDQPHLPLGSRRQGRRRRRALAASPKRIKQRHLVPALSSGAARAVRLRGVLRHDGPPPVPRHVAGAARLPHGAGARHRHPRGQDPRHLAGPRRRIRQQGAGVSGLRVRDRRRAQDRAAGEVDRDADREPDEHGLRARLPHGRGDRRHGRGARDGAARGDDRRPRRLRRCGRSVEVSRRNLRHRHRQLRFSRRARRSRRVLHEQGAGRHRVSLLVPRHRGELRHRARHGHPGRRAGHGRGRSCAGRTSSARSSFRIRPRSASPTTAATITARSTSRSRRSATRRC